MSPQCEQVLRLLRQGPTTGVEAAAVFRIRHLPRRIADLKDHGFDIRTERRFDAAGQRYVRYSLTA